MGTSRRGRAAAADCHGSATGRSAGITAYLNQVDKYVVPRPWPTRSGRTTVPSGDPVHEVAALKGARGGTSS